MPHCNIIPHLSLRMVTVTFYNPIPGWKRTLSHNVDNVAEKPFGNTNLRSQNTTRSCLFSASSILTADSSVCFSSNYISSFCVLPQSFLYFSIFKKTSLHNNTGKKVRICQGSAFKIESMNSGKYRRKNIHRLKNIGNRLITVTYILKKYRECFVMNNLI